MMILYHKLGLRERDVFVIVTYPASNMEKAQSCLMGGNHMMKGKRIRSAVCAWIFFIAVLSGAVYGAQDETERESQYLDPGAILTDLSGQAGEAAGQWTVPDFEGEVHVAAAEGMRSAIAKHYHSEDDMSWIEDASLALKGTSNDTRGMDMEAAFLFNGTQLYHLQFSFDREENTIYLECPELKEEVFAFPIGDFRADAQTITGKKITPEKLAEYTSVLKDFNDLVKSISLDTLRGEWLKYSIGLGEYIHAEKGFASVSAGSLQTEANATTWTIEASDLEELIPKALLMLSEDELLEQILKSSFAERVFRMTVGEKASKLLPQGALWQLVQQMLSQASEKDYAKGHSVSAMLALDHNNIPVHLSVSMEKSGMKADLININGIFDGSDHAFEGKLGPAFLRKLKIKANQPWGLAVQGSLKDDILKETLSISYSGMTMPVLIIRNLDLLAIRDGWLSGDLTASWQNMEWNCEFFTDEDGLRTMLFRVNGTEWFTLTADLKKAEDISLEPFDVSDAFRVDSRKAFFKYMRDASAIRMFEKLSSAGVPQEYVDMLTDGEAATESSRENTVEMEEE